MRFVFVALVAALGVLAPAAAEAQYYGPTNVAKGQPVVAATGNYIGVPQYVTDGKADTYWFSGYAQEYTIDLGRAISIGKIVVFAYQASGVVISSSLDGATFTSRHTFNATDAQHGNWVGGLVTGPLTFESNGTYAARYLKYQSVNLGCGCYQGTGEFAVYEWVSTPPPVVSGGNLATLAGVTATNVAPFASAPGFPPSNVVDGDLSTLWTGAHAGWYTGMAGQQLGYVYGRAKIDLGAEFSVHGVRVRRPAAGGAQTVSISLYDGADQEIAWFGDGDPAVVGTTNLALGDIEVVLDAAAQVRFIRIYQINPLVRTLTTAPALAEVEVYGATDQPDSTPPVLTGVPNSITAEASGPDGAIVTWAAPSAIDDVDGAVTPSCSPASGSTFPVGVTTITCTATDNAGNSQTATFAVTVIGASDQLALLSALLSSLDLSAGLANSLGMKLRNVQASIARGDLTAACGQLGAFVSQAGAQSGKGLTAEQALQLQEAAGQIQQVLGC